MKKFLLLLIIAIAGLTQNTFGQTVIQIGTGTTVPSVGSNPSTGNAGASPYGINVFSGAGGKRVQILYTAAQINAALTAAGLPTGIPYFISTTSWDVSPNVGSTSGNQTGTTIRMKNTAATSLATGTPETALTTVFGPTAVTFPTTGTGYLVTNTLATTFTWDGTSNLAVEYCYTNSVGGASTYGACRRTDTPGTNQMIYANVGCSQAFVTPVQAIPNMRVTVAPATPCSGTPASLAVSPSTPAICSSATATIALAVNGSGYTYQWQESNAIGGPYVNVTGGSGATTANFTTPLGSALPYAPTYYRCNVTCTASGQTTASQISTVSLNSFLNCYCLPTWTQNNAGTRGITQVLLNGSPIIDNTSTVNNVSPYYTVYTAASPVSNAGLALSTAYTLQVKVGSQSTAVQHRGAAWIDYNQNGVFETTEYLGTFGPIAANATGSINFTVPGGALTGTTAMRVIGRFGTSGTVLDNQPCAAFTGTLAAGGAGEVEDYRVNITGAACSGTPTAGSVSAVTATVCPNSTSVINLSGQTSGVSGITFQWQSSATSGGTYTNVVGGSGATTASYTTPALTNGTGSPITYYYKCLVTCTNGGGNATQTTPASVTVNPTPAVTVSPTSASICNPGNTSLTASNSSDGTTTYAWSPASGLSSTTGATVTANPTTTTTYTVTGTAASCSGNTTVTVTVNLANLACTPASASVAIGNSVSLTASATSTNGAVTYTWSPASGLSATTGATVTATPLSTTTYTITATDGICTNTRTVTVTVNSGTSGSVSCGYTFAYTTVTWAAISGGTLLGTGNAASGPTDDVSYANQSIGFNFDYNGITYSTLGVNTNCFVWFGATTPGGNSYIPISTTQAMEGVISVMGQDMIGNAAVSTIRIQTTGSAPNRVCIIQWDNFRAFSGSSRGDYQIRLYETTNIIELRYHHSPYPITDAYIGQVGLRGASNTDFNNRNVNCSANCNNWNSSISGTSNTATCIVDGTFAGCFTSCSTTPYPPLDAVYRFSPNIATPTITPTGTQNICLGGPGTTLTANTTVSSPTYQWLLAGSTIGGATSSTYLANPSPAGNYFYAVRVTNGSGCSRTSYATAVVVNPAPSVPTGLTNQTRCGGSGTVTFTVADPGVGNTIEWSTDGSTTNGSTGLTYSPNVNVGTPVNVYARAKTTVSGCTSAWTSVATGTAYNNPAAPTITPSGSTAICTGGNIDLTSSYTTGNVWSTTATTQTINVNTAGSFTVTYTDGNNCSATSATTTTTLISCGPMQWTGASSTNWDTPGNWTPAGPPNAGTDITIPNVANDPVISLGGNAACKDVDISSGATILVDAGKTLDVKGEWTGANNIVSGGGKTIFSGTAGVQTITGGGTFSTLQINNSNGTTIASGGNFVNVTKALELKAGVLTTNGNLKTKSTSSAATAYIDDFSSGFTGSLSGVVSVERFIPPSPSGFRYVGQPVNTGAGVMAISAMQGFTVTGQPGQTIPLPTCSPTFNPINVAINSPYGNLMYFHENGPYGSPACRQRGWWFQTTGNLTVGRGYGIKQGGNTIITFKGNVNSGTVTSTAASTYTNVWSQAGDNGWNLVSNPFPSAITLNNTDGISQLSDNPATSNNMPYGYTYALQFYITGNSTQTGSYVVRNVLTQPTDIALGQGFWVRVDPAISSSATWKLGQGHRITSAPTYYDVNPAIESHLNVKVLGNNMEDVSDIYFIGAADNDLDLYDGNKWESATGHPTLYTKAGSEVMGINSLPSLTETKVVPMGLKPGSNGNFTFTFEDIASFPQTAMIYLEDLKLGTMNNLRDNATYEFAANLNDSPDRFMLHFQPGLQAEVADQDCDNAGSIELTQPAPTVWSTYEVKGNDNNVYATGTNLTGTVTVSNLPAQEYVVTVTHPSGYSSQEYITVNGSNPISASVNASSTLVMVDEMVTLTANATNANEYVWNFGDGNTQTGSANVVHAYDAEGTYNVTLTTSNSDCNSEATKIIKVNNTATGINGTSATNLNIYGQGEHVVIEFNKWGGDKADIFMYNTLGQRMESLTGVSTLKGRQELSISDIKPGYYFIQVVSNGKVLGKKVFLGKQ